ncbi:MAG: YhbY family RNA-binding protein [Candidatus Nanoarchaeia archaeon]|nr:YhbY family RNA-binding protein [Candidatus Nanoarchaeia archaeon]MDD5357607.1 YhbY family RNA-binding protein [Candidatus Nanoarchaeia archaeon]MDD5588526.1 YhbY family RNA-binding protein [Candidatus Nanoarchaeia archaeon]
MSFTEMQLGKNGLTESFIQTLKSNFEKHETVRISVLKSAGGKEGRTKNTAKKYSEEMLDKLGKNYTARLIGFKIILKKWRKAQR